MINAIKISLIDFVSIYILKNREGGALKNWVVWLCALLLLFLYIPGVEADVINDNSNNNDFTSAINLDGYFSLGPNSDVGNSSGYNSNPTKTPDPESIPWVSVIDPDVGGEPEFYSFTTPADNTPVWLDIDYGQETPYGAISLNTDYNTRIQVYDSEQNELSLGNNQYQDGYYGYGGTGSSIYDTNNDTTLDAFAYAHLDAGTYFIKVSGPNDSYTIPQDGAYHLQVSVENHPVPIPSALWLLSSGLIAIAGIRRKINK